MTIKSPSGKHLILENVRFSYREKDSTIHMTSHDDDLDIEGIHFVIKPDSENYEALFALLEQHGITHNPTQLFDIPYRKGGPRVYNHNITIGTEEKGKKAVINLEKEETPILRVVGTWFSFQEFIIHELQTNNFNQIDVIRIHSDNGETLGEIQTQVNDIYTARENDIKEAVRKYGHDIDLKPVYIFLTELGRPRFDTDFLKKIDTDFAKLGIYLVVISNTKPKTMEDLSDPENMYRWSMTLSVSGDLKITAVICRDDCKSKNGLEVLYENADYTKTKIWAWRQRFLL